MVYVTISVLKEHSFLVMESPGMGPHLNPIEQAWDMLDRHIKKRSIIHQTLQ